MTACLSALRGLLAPALFATILTLPATIAAPALADEHEDPEELARQGMEQMLRAIELMIEMIPQYDVPIVNENGDIIIKRRNPPAQRDDDGEAEDAEPEESQT